MNSLSLRHKTNKLGGMRVFHIRN